MGEEGGGDAQGVGKLPFAYEGDGAHNGYALFPQVFARSQSVEYLA